MDNLMAIFQKEFTPYKKSLIDVNSKVLNGLNELKAAQSAPKK